MNGVDLAQFQFDYDLTWAALFLHPDGTVYARYGSRAAAGPMVHNSKRGLLSTMRAVLDAHAGYPENRHLFAAKRGPAPAVARPEEFPSRRVALRSRPVGRGNCIHCHNVHELFHEFEKRSGDGLPKVVYKFPPPENAGLIIETDSGRKVASVRPDSPAARAGLEKGDELLSLDGQAVFSIADVQFVLHHAADVAELDVELLRGGRRLEKTLRLAAGWRRTDFSWRVSMKGFPDDPGLYLRVLEPDEKSALGIEAEKAALAIEGLFKAAVRASGLSEGDVIVGYDGETAAISAPRFKDHIRVHHFRPGSVMKLHVLRDGEIRRIDVRF